MMMKKLALATLVAMGMSAAAIAQQPAGQSDQRSTQPSQQTREATPAPRGGDRTEQVTFERADKNADGRISREEGNDIDGFDFSRADTNNDASLSRQEYQAAMATSTPREGPAARNDSGSARSGDASASSRSGQSGAASGGASARSQSSQSDQAADGRRDRDDRDADDRRGGQSQQGQRSAQLSFDTVDKDKDGKITRAEAEDVDGLNFSSADTNADASLSRQEFQVAMAGAQPRG
jgi:Ca2+-binding EF-hand superfamily protein